MKSILTYFILILIPLALFPQKPQVYFSITSDTVLFNSRSDKETDSIFNLQSFTILSADNKTTSVVSHFVVRTKKDVLYKRVSLADTLKKFSLTKKGHRVKSADLKTFDVSVKHDDISVLDTLRSNKLFHFKTNVSVTVKFKQDTLISKSYFFFFKGQSSQDFNIIKTYHVEAFEDPRTGKVLIEFSLRDKPVIIRPDKRPSYFFSYYHYIL